MLPKGLRLTSSDVQAVLEKGKSVYVSLPKGQRSLISAKFLATSGHFRAAVVVPKSVARGAVDRNRVRRAAYRALAALPKPKKAGIAVFFVRSVPTAPLTPAFLEEINVFLDKISS